MINFGTTHVHNIHAIWKHILIENYRTKTCSIVTTKLRQNAFLEILCLYCLTGYLIKTSQNVIY